MITVISYPYNEINYSIADPTSTTSAEMVKNIWIDLSETITDEYVEVSFNSETITLFIQDECRYEPMDIAFQNKYGALQFLTFLKLNQNQCQLLRNHLKLIEDNRNLATTKT